MNDFAKHLKDLDDIGYDLDFRDLYHFHNDTWITRDHVSFIPLTNLSTGHIINCIAFIEKHNIEVCFGLGKIWLPKLKKELKRRGKE